MHCGPISVRSGSRQRNFDRNHFPSVRASSDSRTVPNDFCEASWFAKRRSEDALPISGFVVKLVQGSEPLPPDRWRYRLGVRTEDSQSSNPGSIPGSATKTVPGAEKSRSKQSRAISRLTGIPRCTDCSALVRGWCAPTLQTNFLWGSPQLTQRAVVCRRCSLAFMISLMSPTGRISKMLPNFSAGCCAINCTA